MARRPGSRGWRTDWLYVRALLHEFRWSIVTLLVAVTLGGLLLYVTPLAELGDRRPTLAGALYAAWLALLGQPPIGVQERWYLLLLEAGFPLLGLALIGEGVVRFGLLMLSRRRGEKEWMKVMASTYRNHVVLCGLGHLGFRVLEELLAAGVDAVAIERDTYCRFLAAAKDTGIPVLERDMKDDQALVDAGVGTARAIIIASNDDLGNLEVALDARRMNPGIRVVMRLFDQQIATKVRDAFALDQAFSASALAAPAVAAMVMETSVLASFKADGASFLTVQVEVAGDGPLEGLAVGAMEERHGVRCLARWRADTGAGDTAGAEEILQAGDRLVLAGATERVTTLIARLRP